jgi:hypothetical protein
MKEMKKVRLLSLLLMASLFVGCGPNDQTILKKYETCPVVDASANKAGINLELVADSVGQVSFHLMYSAPALNFYKENASLLSERLLVVNAENPSEHLGIETATTTYRMADGDSIRTGYFSTIILTGETKVRYALVCFKGIGKDEFERAETPPCFFIVSLDKKNPHLLTDVPLEAGDLVTADYPKGKFIRFTEPQTYSGTVPFEKSKDVELTFVLSADATQATELYLTAKELYLYPNKSHIKSMTVGGGLTLTSRSPVDIPDGKIEGRASFLVCDLTIADACIYGTVQVAFDDGATKNWKWHNDRKYVVLRNTTTPQEVPADILEPEK